jgi:hypothetical protein
MHDLRIGYGFMAQNVRTGALGMDFIRRTCAKAVWLCLVLGLAGCQSHRMVDHYLSFDAAISDLYEKHVLYNLARRDSGGTMVQMTFSAFSGNLTDSVSTSGQVSFFTNPQTTGNGTNISVNAWQQVFQPNVSSSVATGLSISSVPSDNQDMIRALYDEQVNRPEESRIFRRTGSMLARMGSYCGVRMPHGEQYYVPFEKRREFADFVHKVSFYKFPPPPLPQAPATAPTSAPATAPAAALAARGPRPQAQRS